MELKTVNRNSHEIKLIKVVTCVRWLALVHIHGVHEFAMKRFEHVPPSFICHFNTINEVDNFF